MKNNQYLSKEHTNCLRGIFAIVVIIHHLYQYTRLFSGTLLGEFLQLSGSLAVAMFFFFSGYGLMFSANKKNYIQNFFRNRFLPLYCFYIVLVVLYSLWTLLLERSISPKWVIQSFFFGNTVVTNGWYLQVIFVLYLLYLLIFKIFKSPKIQILLFGIASVFYMALGFWLHLNVWWYQTVFCMVFGMVYCYKKDMINIILAKYAWEIFILTGILFTRIDMINGVSVLFYTVFSLFFICFVLSFSYILHDTPIINNSFFSLCGKYSLELYVSHGFFLRLIKLNIIENKFIYIFVVIVGTIVMSAIMKKVYIKITNLFSKPQ